MIWRTRSSWPTRSLFRELDGLQREMSRLMGEAWRTTSGFPAVNILAGEEDLLVTAELPGVDPSEIEISLEGDTLTLSGARSAPEIGENSRYHRRERSQGRFSRTINLPFRPDVDNVRASYEAGVLRVTIPQAEDDKPRKISVSAS